MRILVAIANHGTKNQRFLEQLLTTYRTMPFEVDLVVLSDVPKDFGRDVEVVVGAPTPDPRSLPFGHRQLFADRLDHYDLFIYSEDDTLVTAAHVRAFLEVDAVLPEDLIPSFFRYEVRPSGERSYCSVHTIFHWDPQSVQRHGDMDFAVFTNAHAAVYMATTDHLRRAIGSGGYLCAPHRGLYSQMVSAATDIYTRCGLQRVMCLTRIDEFLLHHLPNVYLDRMGVTPQAFKLQLQALDDIASGRRDSRSLITAEADMPTPHRSRRYFGAEVCEDLHFAVGREEGAVLSVGCTDGALEAAVLAAAREVVGVPVDEVVAALARDRGIHTTAPDLDAALAELQDRRFELIVLHDLLQHVPNPPAVLARLRQVLAPTGRIVATVPNMQPDRLRAAAGRPRLPVPPRVGGFATTGIHYTDRRVTRAWARLAGYAVTSEAGHLSGRARPMRRILPPSGRRRLGTDSVFELRPCGPGTV